MPREIDIVQTLKKSLLIAAWVAGCVSGIGQAQAQEWTVDAVMDALRGLQYAKANFKEIRHSTFLVEPIKLSGNFVYKAPRTFIKETYKPFPEIVTVDENGVKIEQEKEAQEGQSRTQFIAADAHPLVKGLVDSAEATMSGKKELLEVRYDLEISGTEKRWTVKLTPKEEALRKKLDSLYFEGSGDLIDRAEIRETDGDWSVINLEYLKVERN
jgi:outer membrane lipoprotein-sorting protein